MPDDSALPTGDREPAPEAPTLFATLEHLRRTAPLGVNLLVNLQDRGTPEHERVERFLRAYAEHVNETAQPPARGDAWEG